MKKALIQIISIFLLCIFCINKKITNVKYTEEKSIGIMTISFPKNYTDINEYILEEVDNILDKIDINKIKVLIITDDSSSNENIKNIECDNVEENLSEYIFEKLEQFDIPIISVINNYALGIMFEISLASDIVLCSDNAKLGYPLLLQSNRLSKIIGSGMAKQIMFTKQIINSKEALRIGLINEIYPKNELIIKAKELSLTISKNSNIAIKKAKQAINEGNKYINYNTQNIFKLKCACQNYDWGKYANNSLVATALRKNGDPVNKTKKYAEYWMGTHQNGPSKIIKNNKEILLSDEIGGQLPYLFKILSINKPLSIQLHPDKAFAEILHNKYPKIYKDDNRKPELFIALSDFELLFGLVELDQAVDIIKKYKKCFNNLKEGENLVKKPNIENYKKFIEKLIFLKKEEYEKIIKLIINSNESKNDPLIKKLYDNFGLDPGILISLFMNHLHKKKGEAVFIDENIPHSYIDGNCLELMSCSDNVIRLGLTPKLVDKDNFNTIVKKDFEDMIYSKSNKNNSDFMEIDKKNNIIKYDIKHIDDFKMDVYEIKENRYINIEKNSILFCMEGNIKINGIKCEEFNSYFVKNKINKAKIELCDGYKYSQLYKIYTK